MSPQRKEPDSGMYSGRFAMRLRKLREKKGMSVQELADILEVKPITIYTWEQGRSSPHIDTLPALAETFGFKRIRDILPEK